MNLDSFCALAATRRAIRRFRSDPVPDEILYKLLDAAQWAPSGFNLQPTHYFIVTDQELKEKLYPACLQQPQIVEAPTLVVFLGDRRVVQHNLDRVIDMEYENGSMTEEYEAKLRRRVALHFDQGPCGLGWLAKLLGAPIMRFITPMPILAAVYKRYWLAKQVMLSAMSFLLGAEAAGLATSPIEGFDEWRVRHVLGIPHSYIVPVIVAVGYPLDPRKPKKTRLPLEVVSHWNEW